LVVGDAEMQDDAVAVRTRRGEDLGKMSVDAFIELLSNDVSEREIK
jgi:threonyl-tRNA synthetase